VTAGCGRERVEKRKRKWGRMGKWRNNDQYKSQKIAIMANKTRGTLEKMRERNADALHESFKKTGQGGGGGIAPQESLEEGADNILRMKICESPVKYGEGAEDRET